jgi:uncharacterized protein (TIGR03435 family)
MLRWLYIQLIWLHPAPFRWRFGDDMLDDFDRARLRDKPRYFADAAASLARQWLLRPEFRRPEAAAATTASPAAGVPLFQTIETYKPRPAALLHGGFLTILLFFASVVVIGKGGVVARPFRIGAHFSRPGLLPIDRSSLVARDLNTTVDPGPDTSGPWPSPATPKFEVVSIRRHTARSGPVQVGPTPDGYRSIGLPLFAIFQSAYELPNQHGLLRGNQIEGDPGWLSEELYDVVAKVDQADLANWQKPEMRQTMLRAMLQAMLSERCRALVHFGSKEMPVYDLVIAKGGATFKQAETLDTAELRQRHPTGGMMRATGTIVVPGPATTHFYAISLATLANTILSSLADRPVVDKTGLAGYYDLALSTSALKPPPPLPHVESQPLDVQPLEDESIFTALPEALGLRLEPAKGRVGTLVIDRVKRPSEN